MSDVGLAAIIDRVLAELPPSLIDSLVAQLEIARSPLQKGQLVQLTSAPHSRRFLAELEGPLAANPAIDLRLVALAMRSSRLATERERRRNSIEIAWTGPGTDIVPVRRVDQVMYEMVASARQSVLLVSYVTYGADRLLDELARCVIRGVAVSLILERAEDTGGKLAFDGLQTIRKRLPRASIYYWPRDRRNADGQGRIGILHAKCLVCDDMHALVSSANLTDNALELNMELGLVVTGEDVPSRIANHFRQLILQGELQSIDD